jgi:hypothetical protein
MTEDVAVSRVGHEPADRGVRTSSIVEVDEARRACSRSPFERLCA